MMHPSLKNSLKEKGSVFLCVAEDDSTRTSFEWLNTLNVAGSLVWVTEY